jgi:hypothetical protein
MYTYASGLRGIPPGIWTRLERLLPILESEHKRYAEKRRQGLERRLAFLWERKVASARAAASMAVELRKGAKSLPEDDAMLIQQKRPKTP